MKPLAIMLLFFTAVLLARAEDMQKYLRDTQALVKAGKYQEALDRFLWFHDHALEQQPSMVGVRLSFALMYWKQLGDVYPPAQAALKKTRDDKTTLFYQGQGSPNLFQDVVALNRTLGENGRTVELFRKLDQEQKELASKCWVFAKDVVFQAGALNLAGKYSGDPVREFVKVKETFLRQKTIYEGKNLEAQIKAQMKAYNENEFVEETLRLIELAITQGDAKAAGEIQAGALSALDDGRLRKAGAKVKKEEEVQKTNLPSQK